eukprot:705777-Amphidinium_carterae.1
MCDALDAPSPNRTQLDLQQALAVSIVTPASSVLSYCHQGLMVRWARQSQTLSRLCQGAKLVTERVSPNECRVFNWGLIQNHVSLDICHSVFTVTVVPLSCAVTL